MATYGNIPPKSPTVQDTLLSIFRNEIERLEIAIKLARDVDSSSIQYMNTKDASASLKDAPPPPKPIYKQTDLHDAIIAASGYITTIKNFLPLITIANQPNAQ